MSTLFFKIIRLFPLLFCTFNVIYSHVNFLNKSSKITVESGTLSFLNATSNWNGTLEISNNGTIAGSDIFFNRGFIETSQGISQIQGSITPSALRPVTLNTQKKVFADPNTPIGALLVLGTGNILSGQPEFVGTCTLLNQFSELQINITNRLNKSIAMNNGTIKLLNDLSLGDDVTLTGSGKVNLNNRTLKMPAKETTWTSKLFFEHANDVVLNAKTTLSGTWTFSGSNAVLQGNGNILDLTSGGTLWIKAGSDVEFTDVHIRGLGHIYGSIIFENGTSRIRLSNATLQLASNYSVTQGGIYVEGANSLIVTGTNTLTIATGASMTVDRITLFADALAATATVNISPNIPDNQKLIYLNSGIMKATGGGSGDGQLSIDNSNAIVGWAKDTSNAVSGLLVVTSNAVVADRSLTNFNSNAIVSARNLLNFTSNAVVADRALTNFNSNAIVTTNNLAVDNSDAIIGWILDTSNSMGSGGDGQLAIDNSNAIVGWIQDTSNSMANGFNQLAIDNSNAIITTNNLTLNNSSAVVFANSLAVFNSHAILSLSQGITDNSTAIVGWIQDTSNSMANGFNQLALDNSNAIVGWIQDTSNSMANGFNQLAIDNSNAIITTNNLTLNNSSAVVFANSLAVFNSHAIKSLSQGITDNSTAIVGWVQDTSNSLANGFNQLAIDNSNAIIGWIQDTSNSLANGFNQLAIDNSTAIVGWIQDTSNSLANGFNQLAIDNSNAISGWLADTSSAVVFANSLAVFNSNAIKALSQGITDNSTAIVGWIQDTSNSLANGFNQLAIDNSNAIIGWVQDTSNSLANGFNQLAIDNSTAIVGWIQDTSNSMANGFNQLAIDNSNAIITTNNVTIANSNAIVGWVADTSQAVFNFVLYNSQAIVTIETLNLANSYAIIATNELTVANSWATVSLYELAVATSDALLANQALDIETSNAVVTARDLANGNSNAIVGWIQDTSNAVAGLLVATSNAANWARSEADRANDSLLTVDHGPAHIHMSGAMTMSFDTYTSPDHQLQVHASGLLNGAGHAIKLGRTGTAIAVDAGVTVTLQDVVLKDFDDARISLGVGSALYFGQDVVLELNNKQSISRTWTFAGYGTIKGNAEELALGDGQNYLVVLPNAGLTLKDVLLTNVRDNNIRCMGDSSVLTLENTLMQLSSDYSFTSGSISFLADTHISGTSQFNYNTLMGSTIASGARVHLEVGSKLNYAPSGPFKDLLVMTDSTSQLRMIGASLVASATGCQLTKGTLMVDGLNTIESSAANIAEGVVFGDGTPANDLIVEILPGAGLDVTSGYLHYNNAN